MIILVALTAALVYVVVVPRSEENGTPAPSPTPSPAPQDETAGWKTYRNDEYGFEIKYPGKGEVGDGFKNAYWIKFRIADNTSIDIFTDKSVNEWEAEIEQAIEENLPVGDSAMFPYSLAVKDLLKTRVAGYNCTADFGIYLNKEYRNESCEIVEINDIPAFKIIAAGPHPAEYSEYKYIFYENGRWYDISKSFARYNFDESEEPIYTIAQLNAILQGKTFNPEIKAEVDLFQKILSSFRFTK
ncbi:MAG: hypothetical protein HY396_00460 [Candidatus Doudnabacteria bacterium]|nr:hypothetical protein [Candidatus Doudnabacteria bacterium]